MRSCDFLVVGTVLQADVFSAQRDQDLVQLHVIIDVFLALFAFDLIERRLRNVNFAGAHQILMLDRIPAHAAVDESVKLALYSEKEPDKPDTRAVDPPVIERIWQDFALYRSLYAAGNDRH